MVERNATDADWRELFARPNVLHDPAPSLDGTTVAFSGWQDGRYRISEWNRASKSIRVILTGDADYRYPAYSPSSRWLFYSQKTSGQWDLGRLWLDSGRREPLTTSEANDFMPAVSPDERTVYFASDRRRGYRFSAIYRLVLR